MIIRYHFIERYLSICLFLLLICTDLGAQQTVGLLPNVVVSQKLKDLKVNYSWQSRVSRSSDTSSDPEWSDTAYRLSDLSIVATRSWDVNKSMAAGALYRINADGANLFRLRQHIGIISPWQQLRVSHRILLDESFVSGRDPLIRLRYRLSTDLPLNGTQIDNNEWYLKSTIELLQRYRSSTYRMDLRGGLYIGRKLTNSNKIELGIDYRHEGVAKSNAENIYWLAMSLYTQLPVRKKN